jgi:hypothetical protein
VDHHRNVQFGQFADGQPRWCHICKPTYCWDHVEFHTSTVKNNSKSYCWGVGVIIGKLAAVMGVAGVLAACAASGVQVTEQQAQSFQVGRSTYSEVIAALGEPTTVGCSNGT